MGEMSQRCCFNDTATTGIYTYLHTLSLPGALPIWQLQLQRRPCGLPVARTRPGDRHHGAFQCDGCRSEEHTSELQSLMRISYAGFCLKKEKSRDMHIDTL